MKQKWSKIFACLLLAVFVNFMFSNALFMHLHKDATGHSILHSHPYLPKTPHNHSSSAIDLINAFNVAATTAQSVDAPLIATPTESVTTLIVAKAATTGAVSLHTPSLRAPPVKI